MRAARNDPQRDEHQGVGAVWRVGHDLGLPDVANNPGVFVVVGMMACFGSVAHAPLAVTIMVAEMTGSFSVLPGAMVAVAIAYLLISRTGVTIYQAQRLDRWPRRPNGNATPGPTNRRQCPLTYTFAAGDSWHHVAADVAFIRS